MYPEKITDLSQVNDKLYHIWLNQYTSQGFELITLVVIGTDCTSSCKSYYHMIKTMMTPSSFQRSSLQSIVQRSSLQSIVQRSPLQSIVQRSSLQSIVQRSSLQSIVQRSSLQSIVQRSPLQSIVGLG